MLLLFEEAADGSGRAEYVAEFAASTVSRQGSGGGKAQGQVRGSPWAGVWETRDSAPSVADERVTMLEK